MLEQLWKVEGVCKYSALLADRQMSKIICLWLNIKQKSVELCEKKFGVFYIAII